MIVLSKHTSLIELICFVTQADARYMPDIASGTYDVLFDKGTLDAIASGGSTDAAKTQVAATVLSLDLSSLK